MRCLTLRSRRWGSYWGSQGQGGPRKWRQRPGEGSLSPEGDCGRKAVNARKAYLEHAEVCGFPFLDFPPVLQSEGQDPRLEGHWNLRLEYIHWAAGFVDWPSTAINLAKMQFFFFSYSFPASSQNHCRTWYYRSSVQMTGAECPLSPGSRWEEI